MLLVQRSSNFFKDIPKRRRSTSVSTGSVVHSSSLILEVLVTPLLGLDPDLLLFFQGSADVPRSVAAVVGRVACARRCCTGRCLASLGPQVVWDGVACPTSRCRFRCFAGRASVLVRRASPSSGSWGQLLYLSPPMLQLPLAFSSFVSVGWPIAEFLLNRPP